MAVRLLAAALSTFAAVLPSVPRFALAEQAAIKPAAPEPISGTEETAAERRFSPGCAVAIPGGRNGSRWLLPRASLVVANRSPYRVTLRMEARAGIEAAGTDLGPLGPGETRTFRHVVPAGRSVALAQRYESSAMYMRQPIYIWNHGPLTCQRRFIWVLR
jgi:hypothetical protein